MMVRQTLTYNPGGTRAPQGLSHVIQGGGDRQRVPDGGSMLALLGLGLTSIEGLRRKLSGQRPDLHKLLTSIHKGSSSELPLLRERERYESFPHLLKEVDSDFDLRAAGFGPVDVEKLAARMVGALVGVRAEVVALALQQLGGEFLRAVV